MGDYFRRQLTDYVEYHRDPRNGLMHVFGIISLFLAAVLPLSQWPVPAFGAPVAWTPAVARPVETKRLWDESETDATGSTPI